MLLSSSVCLIKIPVLPVRALLRILLRPIRINEYEVSYDINSRLPIACDDELSDLQGPRADASRHDMVQGGRLHGRIAV